MNKHETDKRTITFSQLISILLVSMLGLLLILAIGLDYFRLKQEVANIKNDISILEADNSQIKNELNFLKKNQKSQVSGEISKPKTKTELK